MSMEFTYFGALALPAGMLLLFLAPSRLIDVSIFFIPFSATSVVNITKSVDSASGLPPWMFFGALYMLSEAIRATSTRYDTTGGSVWRSLPVPQMLFFLFTILASLIMPWWIDGAVWIRSPYLNDVSAAPLYFGLEHITATLYIIYGLLFTVVLATRCADVPTFRRYLSLYCLSSLFVCVWGGMQLVLYLLNLPYPASIFNSSVSPGADLYAEFSVSGLKRLSSVTVEPSVLAGYLFTILPFVLFRVIARRPLLSPFCDKAISAMVLVTLLLSTSTTAYFGLLVFIPILVYCMFRLRLMRTSHLVVGGVILWVMAAFAFASPAAKELLATDVAGKFSTNSGLERAGSVTMAVRYFYQYPLLGVGWGSVTCWNLIVSLLANTGILGVVSFVVFVATCFNRLRVHFYQQRLCDCTLTEIVDSLACLVALAVLLVLNVVTGFAYVFGHLWFILALSIGIPLQRCVMLPTAAFRRSTA